MPHSRIVVIGASAGGFEAVRAVLETLPDHFPASVLVVIHTGPGGVFPAALARNTPLPVVAARDGERLEEGRVYVAPPDQHLTVTDGVVRVARGPREHGFRPAIDPLFTTAARAAGKDTAGVILSGALSDGTIGLHAIKHAGGLALVRHPEEAPLPSMPLPALRGGGRRPAGLGDRPATGGVGNERSTSPPRGRAARGPNDTRQGRPPRACAPADGGHLPLLRRRDQRGRGERPRALRVPRRPPLRRGVARRPRRRVHREHAVDRDEGAAGAGARAASDGPARRQRGLGKLASTWRQEAADAEARADEIRRLIEGAPAVEAEQLVKIGDTRAAGGSGRPARARGRRPANESLAVTRERARLSKQMHQASRARTRGVSNGKPRKGRPASNGKPRNVRRRR